MENLLFSAPIDGASETTVQTDLPKVEALWEQIERFESSNWEILTLALELASAAPEVRAVIKERCIKARAEYEVL